MSDGLKPAHRRALLEILTAHESVTRVVLFGSRAMGTYTTTSDVDLALYGDHLTMTDQATLGQAIDALPMPQRVDLLLHASIRNQALLNHIQDHGVEWLSR